MADKRLDQVTKVTNMAYVPVIMSDGSIGQIAKDDLATVVAGVMNTQQEFPYMYIGIVGIYGQIKDLNQVKTSGFYKVAGFDSSISNTPSGNGYGTLEAIDTGGYILQRYISRNKEIFVRHNMNDIWYPWQRIDNFGYNTLAELSAGVAETMTIRTFNVNINAGESYTISTSYGLCVVTAINIGSSVATMLHGSGCDEIVKTGSFITVSPVSGSWGNFSIKNTHNSTSSVVKIVVIGY